MLDTFGDILRQLCRSYLRKEPRACQRLKQLAVASNTTDSMENGFNAGAVWGGARDLLYNIGGRVVQDFCGTKGLEVCVVLWGTGCDDDGVGKGNAQELDACRTDRGATTQDLGMMNKIRARMMWTKQCVYH